MEDEQLADLADAIEWARERYPLWIYVLKTEGDSPAFKRAENVISGEHLIILRQATMKQMRRVLREVGAKSRNGLHPSAVWLMSDTTPSSPTRKEEIAAAGDIQAQLRGAATFRILGARLGYPVTGDDLREVLMTHENERARATGDEPEF